MITKLRVMVTDKCGKNCDGCCNKSIKPTREVTFEELCDSKYDGILLTGGDPAMYPAEVTALATAITDKSRFNDNHRRLYVYLSSYPFLKEYEGGFVHALEEAGVSGIHYTVHAEATDEDILQLSDISFDLIQSACCRSNICSCRLAIDSRLYERYDFSNINLTAWQIIRKMKWVTDCPLPEGEELVTFNMLEWYKSVNSKK